MPVKLDCHNMQHVHQVLKANPSYFPAAPVFIQREFSLLNSTRLDWALPSVLFGTSISKCLMWVSPYF